MKKEETNDIEIIYEDLFEWEYDDFSVFFNKTVNFWYIMFHDEEKFDEIIILEDGNNKFNKDIYLLDNYVFTVKEFLELKEYITNIIDNQPNY